MNLIILYENKLLCEKNRNEIDFIHVPHYFTNNSDFANISIFLTLLTAGIMDDNYGTSVKGDFSFWNELNEQFFFPEVLIQVDKDTYFYSLDEVLSDFTYENKIEFLKFIEKLPKSLLWKKQEEIKNTQITMSDYHQDDEDALKSFSGVETCNDKLINVLKINNQKRKKNDVLLLYSGGKDSTLAAILLKEKGYNSYFIHFNNGVMRDSDKPFLTFQKTFYNFDGYIFPYEYSDVDIKTLFQRFFACCGEEKANPLLTSEIRCLSCRMAMYAKAFEIAKSNNFKIIAEGARISQKFFIEQETFIPHIQEIASRLGMSVLFPVLDLADDKLLITELLKRGFSSKTWESKCLLGESAVDKTKEDEQVILNYYSNHIRPKILKYLNID